MKKNTVKYTNIFIYALYIVSAILFIIKKDFFNLFITSVCIGGTFILSYINKKYNRLLDNALYIGIILFIMIASLLGTCYGFYSINHYDDFLHVISGALGCVVAWSIYKYCNVESKYGVIFLAIFLFMFNMGVASLWEIMEFCLDTFFGMNTQAGGLTDTVIDMIDALIGGIIAIPFILKYSKKE
ncbi:MAG: hypothetical protein ACRC92_10520 [Peptostreptococcaceae bacterium]